jgi:transcriptional regulator with PAS, ATPase and Fis domain
MMQEFLKLLSDNWPTITTACVGIGGFLLKVTTLWPKIVKVVKFLGLPITVPFKLNKSIQELNQKVEQVKNELSVVRSDIDGIKKELKNNGGSSLRDKVDEIRDAIEIQNKKVSYTLNNIDSCVIELDNNANCIYSNKNSQKLFNLTEAQMLGKGWLSALDVVDANIVFNKFVESIKNDIPFKYNYRLKNHDFTVEFSTSTTKNKNNKILSVMAEVSIIKESDFE